MRFRAAALVLALIVGLITSTPSANASSRWKDQAWRDMKSLAQAGSLATGRTATLLQVERTCTYLNRGYRASEVLDMYASVAEDSAQTRQELSDMYMYSIALMAVAGQRLCPRHKAQIARVLDL